MSAREIFSANRTEILRLPGDFSRLQGCDVLEGVGGLHKFMGWNRALLTVSEPLNHLSLYLMLFLTHSNTLSHTHTHTHTHTHSLSLSSLSLGQWWISNGVSPQTSRDNRSEPQQKTFLEREFPLQEGVKFRSPHDDSEMVLTPEYSTEIQNSIGADIIMQLDDVVHSSTTGYRVEEAMWRTVCVCASV